MSGCRLVVFLVKLWLLAVVCVALALILAAP